MDEGNELEILLVLCCLVGVTVFLCFALSAVNLSAQVEVNTAVAGTAGLDDPAILQRRLDELQQAVASLTAEAERLARETERKREEAATTPALPAPRDRAAELASLQRQLDEVTKAIDRLTMEIERMKQAGIQRTEREKELGRLLEILEKLKKQIEDKRKSLAAVTVSVDASLETDFRRLRDTVAGLDRQIEELRRYLAGMREEPGIFNVRRNLPGNTTLKNPAIVECRKGGIIFHPEGREMTLADLKSGNPFQQLAGKDGILFLIRPDGFDAFEKGYELAEKTPLPIIFEAVDANLKLKF